MRKIIILLILFYHHSSADEARAWFIDKLETQAWEKCEALFLIDLATNQCLNGNATIVKIYFDKSKKFSAQNNYYDKELPHNCKNIGTDLDKHHYQALVCHTENTLPFKKYYSKHTLISDGKLLINKEKIDDFVTRMAKKHQLLIEAIEP